MSWIDGKIDPGRFDYRLEAVKWGAPTRFFKRVWLDLSKQACINLLRLQLSNILTFKCTVRKKNRDNLMQPFEKVYIANDNSDELAAFWEAHGPLTADELKGWTPVYQDSFRQQAFGSNIDRKTVEKHVAYYETWHMTDPHEMAQLIHLMYPRWSVAGIERIITGEKPKP